MTSIRHQSLVSLVFIYAGFLIGGTNVIFLFPKFFTTEQFGITRFLLEFTVLLSSVCAGGMMSVSLKFFPFYQKYLPPKKNDLLFIALGINIIMLILFIIAMPIFKPLFIRKFSYRSPFLIQFYYLLYPLTIGLTLFNLYEAYAWITKKTILSSFLREFLFRFIISILIIIWALGWFKDFNQFITAFSFSYFPSLIILMVVIHKTGIIYFVPEISGLTKRLSPKMAGFGFAFFASSVLNALARTNDTIILGTQSARGLTDIAVFNVATFIITLMEVPQRSMVGAATPQIAIAWKEKNYTRLASIYSKTAINLLVIGVGLLAIICLNVDELVALLGPHYASIGKILLILGIAKIIDLGTGLNSQILVLSRHWKIDLYSNLFFVVVSLILNYYLTRKLGLSGPAYGGLIAIIFFNLIRFIAIWKIYKLQPFSIENLKVFGIGIFCFFIIWIIPSSGNIYFNVVVSSLLFLTLYGLFVILLKVSPDLTDLFADFKKKITPKQKK
jgi:O-antigen/teichoic acid export membrane protein